MAKKNKGVSNKTRFNVFKRDGFVCQYCGQTPPTVILQVDHIIPVSKDGTNDLDNLVTSCFQCNSGKGAGDLTSIPQTVLEKLQRQKELTKQLAEYNKFLLEIRKTRLQSAERIGVYWCDLKPGRPPSEKGRWMVSDDRLRSIKRFLEYLPEVEIYEAIDIAHTRIEPVGYRGDEKTWKYFCGVCWSKIKQKKGSLDSEGGNQ